MKDSILFETLLNNLTEHIYFKDTDGRFISISKSFANWLGLNNPEEAIGKTDFDFFGEEHAREAFEDEQRIIETGKPLIDKIEKEVYKKTNKKKWVSTSKFPLYEGKNIIGTYGISKNITEKKVAEEKLKESDERFAKLSKLAPGFLFLYEFGLDRRVRFPFASEGIRKLFGLEPEDIRDDFSALIERVHPEDIVRVRESIGESIENLTEWDCEYRVYHPEKGLKWVKGRARPELQNDGTVLSPGYITDITTQKNIEEKLSYNDKLFSKLSELAPGFLFLHKVDEDNTIRFPFASEGIKELFGLAPEEIKKSIKPLLRRVHKDDVKRVLTSIMESVTFLADWNIEYRIHHPTKGLRWVRGLAKPEQQEDKSVLSPGYLSDITELKEASDRNEKLRIQFQSILNAIPNLIFIKDYSGKYLVVNDAACTFFGVSRENFVGKTDEEIGVPKDQAQNYHEADLKVIESKEPLFIPEIKTIKGDGEEYWHQTFKLPYKQIDVEEDAVLTIVTDITDRKQRETELDNSLEIIGQQNQRLTNFAHIVSHNLRNHAGNISMLLDLYDPEESEEEQQEILGYLSTAAQNLNESIADLNEIVDQQQMTIDQFKEVNLREYIEKIKEILVSDILSNNVKFEESVPDDLVFGYNPAYLESILLNLISNAIKYRKKDIAPIIKVKAWENDGCYHLEIADNGLGIDMERHGEKLFGMYKTFHGNENAKGIGLFITKNQIESMGGSIAVESEPAMGTTFKIKLK